MARLAWFVNLIAFVVVGVNAEETAANYSHDHQLDDSNIFGVASVARVTSRNGRISSTGGIHFYPGPNRGSEFNPEPFLKAIDGKYARGSIQIQPGALGISSAAQAGYINPGHIWPMDWPRQWPEWPSQSQIYTPFEDPWDTVKVELPQTKMRQQWVYPSFNPFFNYWR